MRKILNKFMNHGESDEEIDVVFDLLEDDEKSPAPLAPQKENNKMLAVWGSSGSGKTTAAVKLARYIASFKKTIILVLCDTVAPPLPYVCPDKDLLNKQSLANILSAEYLSDELLKQNTIFHKRNNNLCIFSLLEGENSTDCGDYNYLDAQAFLQSLRDYAEFVIVDCSADFCSNPLSAAGLFEADAVLRLVNNDKKSMSFVESQMPLLKSQKWNEAKLFKAISDVEVLQEKGSVMKHSSGVDFKITHSDEVHNQFVQGNLLASLKQKSSINFSRAIAKIANDIFML